MSDGKAADLNAARLRQQAGWLADIAAGGARREKAMHQLSQAWDRRIVRWCRRALNLSREDAEDVWQETLISICRSAHLFDTGRNPVAWILAIVRNRAYDLFRKPHRHHETSAANDDAPAPAADPALPEPATHDSTEQDDCVDAVLAEFAGDHADELHSLLWREIGGWDIPEVAAYLGCNEVAARKRLSRLREALAPLLAPCLELPGP